MSADREELGIPRNGSYVTWRELTLLMEPIVTKLDAIHADVNLMNTERLAAAGVKDFRVTRRTTMMSWVLILATLLAGAIGALVAVLITTK